MKDRSHADAMIELFSEDAEFSALCLTEALNDDDLGAFLVTLRQVVQARGGIAAVAQKAGMKTRQFKNLLSSRGNFPLVQARSVFKALGMRLTVMSIDAQPNP